MSSPPRRSLQTRGRNRPARNALHPLRGARSAVACRALSGAPAPSQARQSGLPRGPRAGRGGSGTFPGWPEPVSGVSPSPRPLRRRPVGHHRRWRRHTTSGTASPVVADVPAVAPWRIGGPVVLLLPCRQRRCRRCRPPTTPAGRRRSRRLPPSPQPTRPPCRRGRAGARRQSPRPPPKHTPRVPRRLPTRCLLGAPPPPPCPRRHHHQPDHHRRRRRRRHPPHH